MTNLEQARLRARQDAQYGRVYDASVNPYLCGAPEHLAYRDAYILAQRSMRWQTS